MEVKVSSIDKLTDYEHPLTVNFDISGKVGSATGKRLLLPSDVFEANSKNTFPHEKRDVAVYFQYPHMVQDAIRINFPPTLAVESLPRPDKLQYAQNAIYSVTTEQTSTSYTLRRNFILGEIVFLSKDYPDLRGFYAKVESKDQEGLVLKVASPGTEKAQAPGGGAD